MGFLENIKADISSFHRERLQKIDSHDYSAVGKKVSKDFGGLTDSYIESGIENLKLYYAVALLDPWNAHAVSRAVDPFWHSHVLFTKNYVNFCQTVFGGYIHHQPLDEDDISAVEEVRKLYVYTLSVYEKLFRVVDNDWYDGHATVRGPVCLHQAVVNPEIRDHALFPINSDVQS